MPSRGERKPEGGKAQEGNGRWCGVTLVLDATDSRVAKALKSGRAELAPVFGSVGEVRSTA